MMQKLNLVLIAFVASSMTLSSFAANHQQINEVKFEEAGSDYIYLTDVTAWSSATDSYDFSIYYKEGNGERIYYFQYSSYGYWDIHDNEYYHSSVCNDFRRNYKYVSGDYYFDCDLPGRSEEIIDGYRFHTQVLGWKNATDSFIFSIYYKEGNGEKEYSFKYSSFSYWDIHDNEYYLSPVCKDFRRNYKYVSGDYYFDCDMPGRSEEIIDGYRFLTQVLGWRNETDSYIFSIYYKEGNGKRIHYFKYSSYSYWTINKNEYYNNPTCNDFRKNYRYVSGDYYFNPPAKK